MKTKSVISNKKSWLSNLLLFCLSTIICLLLVEGGIRLFAPQKLITRYSKIWRPDGVYGWRHQENISTIINSGEGNVHFVTDERGYRINTPGEEPAYYPADSLKSTGNKEYSILFIGDSYLEAIQVENHYTIPQVIKKDLSRYGNKIKVTNASCGRWNPNHYLMEAKHLAPEQYNLAIIFLYLANDVVASQVEQFSAKQIHVHKLRMPKQLSFQEVKAAVLYPVNEGLEANSHFYVLLKKKSKWLRMKWGLSPYYIPETYKTRMQNSPDWQVTTEICKTIEEEFAQYNTPCFFVMLPTDFQADVDIFHSYIKSLGIDSSLVDLDQPQRIMNELFTASSMVVVDPLADMRREVSAGKQLFGYIDCHLNEKGHQVVAEYIEPTISEILFTKHAAAMSIKK